MTTPQQPPPPPQDGLDDPALAVAVAGVIAGVAGPAIAVQALKARFVLTAAATAALIGVLGLVMQHPPPVTGIIGPASEQTSRMNMARRAQYVIAASKRVLGVVRDAKAKGQPVAAAVKDQLDRERRFYAMHQAAMWNRARAAGATDVAAAEYGQLLGWNTVVDAKTSPECKAADGWNYSAAAMPVIGFPGAVHPHCRCYPGPPRPGARLLPSRRTRFARAA